MLTHWARVRRGSSPAGYAYRSAFRLLHRSRRGRRALQESTADDRSEAAADSRAADPEAAATTRVAVAAALAGMPPRRRACAVLCLVVGLSTVDAASALGIAEGTVRKHLADARDDLRHALAP
jgi:RNA polymerase sigma factor (sigma-70 family)